jgi:hypothetical protein
MVLLAVAVVLGTVSIAIDLTTNGTHAFGGTSGVLGSGGFARMASSLLLFAVAMIALVPLWAWSSPTSMLARWSRHTRSAADADSGAPAGAGGESAGDGVKA